ncbi:MAG: DUF3169 family protein [Eubacteriales bacterium]|nr:DUF3169 family protein [Eubacteriales bacterium]
MKKDSCLKMLVGGVVGGVIGFCSAWGGENGFQELFTGARAWMGDYNTMLMGTLAVISLCFSLFCYRKGEAYVRGYLRSEVDEEKDGIEQAYGFLSGIGTAGTSILIWVGVAVFAFRLNVGNLEEAAGLLLGAGLLIFIAIVCAFYQIAMVRQVRRMDPMKRGDAADWNFQKVWLASCDEAEKHVIYEAGYRSFTATRLLLMIATLLVGALQSEAGLLAVVFLTLCNVISMVIYSYYSIRLSRKGVAV